MIIFSVVVFLLLSILIRGVVADGFIKTNEVSDPTANFNDNIDLDPASYNLTSFEQAGTFSPPVCKGYIPVVSDLGCTGAFILWLIGLSQLSTSFVWLNYLIVLPLSIVVGFVIARLLKP
jgi:hypothetical protein